MPAVWYPQKIRGLSCQRYSQAYDNVPSLSVAYVDEVEETSQDKQTIQKVYYSALVKAAAPTKSIDSSEQAIYRIKLPRPAILGEGKLENQNHAIIFTRGEGLQTIDMNQITIWKKLSK